MSVCRYLDFLFVLCVRVVIDQYV